MAKKNLLVSTRDYLVVQPENKKLFVQVTGKRNGKIQVVLDNHLRAHPETAQTFEITRDQVIANLGKVAYYGNAYGTLVEPYLTTTRLRPWGEIHWFVDLAASVRDGITTQLKAVARELEAAGLLGHFPIETFIRNPKGRNAGMWTHFADEDAKDHLTLRPQQWQPAETRRYVWHEIGHYLETNLFTDRQRRRWIKLYHKNVTLAKCTTTQLKELRTSLIDSDLDVRSFGRDLDEDSQPLYDEIISWIRSYHSLEPKHLDILMKPKRFTIKEYWPTDPVQLTDMSVTITEYAQKNPSEYWCEALCYRKVEHADVSLPSDLAAAVDKTLAELRDL